MKQIYKSIWQDDNNNYFIVDRNGSRYINTQEALLLIYLLEVIIAK